MIPPIASNPPVAAPASTRTIAFLAAALRGSYHSVLIGGKSSMPATIAPKNTMTALLDPHPLPKFHKLNPSLPFAVDQLA